MLRVSVPHVNGYTVPVVADREGKQIAYIEEHDGLYGRALHVLSDKTDDEILATGRIMNAAWSVDGTAIAFVTYPADGDASNVWIAANHGQPVPVGTHVDVTRVLGWSADKSELYVARRQPTEGHDAEKFSIISVATGAAVDVFESDLEGHRYMAGFQVQHLPTDQVVVSFIVRSTLVGAASLENYLVVGQLDGKVLRQLPSTSDRITKWVWSKDLDSVAYMVANFDENPERIGLWVSDATGKNIRHMSSESNLSFDLHSWDGKNLVMKSPHHGLATVDSLAPVMPRGSADIAQGIVSPTASSVYAPYVHQVFDTPTVNSAGQPYPNGYALPNWGKNDGGKQDACGPTFAVMVAGGLGFLTSNSVLIPKQANNGQTVDAHYNSFGWYVPSRFTSSLTNYDFNRWDYSAAAAQFGQGAHGAMVQAAVGSSLSGIKSFMTNLSQTSRTATWDPATSSGQTWAQNQLAAGHLIMVNVQYPGMGGHWIVLKGWDPENGYYLANDPYGQYVQSPLKWGQYDGADAKYGWTTMGVKGMVSYW